MKKLLVILGPTSTGKTDLGLSLAKKFNGELISCDSRQVYTGLDIGTGKLPGKKVNLKKGQGFWEMNGIKVWMYDVVDPNKQYTVYNYVIDANKVINGVIKRKRLPIIVGGTGFYLKALLEGLPNLVIPVDQRLRVQLDNLTIIQLQQKLQQTSLEKWNNLNNSDKQNPRRLIRVIELCTVNTRKRRLKIESSKLNNFNILKIGLTAPRVILYQRIDERVKARINQGMVEEADALYRNGLSFRKMRQLGLEYGILADYLQNRTSSKEELVRIMQGKIHGYARRQITWFKKEQNVNWFDITDKNYLRKVEKLMVKWYDNGEKGLDNYDAKN